MGVEANVPLYKPLDGEETKKRFFQEIDRALSDDTRFKKSVVYHEPWCEWQIFLHVKGMPPDEIWIESHPQLKTWMEENRILTEKLDRFKREWDAAMAKIEHNYSLKEQALKQERDEALAERDQLRSELRLKAENVRGVATVSGWETIVVKGATEKVEEPERVRQELEQAAGEAEAASEETIGKQPSEAYVMRSDGRFSPAPVAANSGAVVGGGQRPSSVVGRPK